MRNYFTKIFLVVSAILLIGCQDGKGAQAATENIQNSVRYAKGLAIYDHGDHTVVKVSNPWPDARKSYTYVLARKGAQIPDSLKNYTTVSVPVKSIVATSTTHIPSLEMLGVENSLVGFPNLDYISSEKVRARIESRKIKELGNNQSLNTEIIIDLDPDVVVGYGIDNSNPALDNLQKSGLKIVLNGDWNEQTALGKAEWIKLFGALYGLEDKADTLFARIEKEYNAALALAQKAKTRPTVLAGAMFEDKWYLPDGNSWGAQMIVQGGGKYLFSEGKGSGSLSLPFEKVLAQASRAEIWIGPGQFTSLAEMTASNPHYGQFRAFRKKNVYSFSSKKGKTGGVVYYELAPNRPDLVLKDIVKILHPELLPDYQMYFFEKLK